MVTMVEVGVSSGEIYRLDQAGMKYFWPELLELFEKHPGGFFRFSEPETVKKLIKNNTLDMWVGLHKDHIELGVITAILGEKEKYLEVLWVGGNNIRKYIPKGLKKLEMFGAWYDAQTIVAGGREGWTRMLEPFGFTKHRVEVAKRINYVSLGDEKIGWRQ